MILFGGDIHAETEESEDEVDIANVDTDTAEGAIDSVDAAETVGDAEDGARCAHEVEALEGQPLVGLKTDIATDFTDVGLWPVKIYHEIRAMIVRQGYAAVQHLECEFKEVTRLGTKTKGDTRKLTKTWFFVICGTERKV
jgi:acyl carrier protein